MSTVSFTESDDHNDVVRQYIDSAKGDETWHDWALRQKWPLRVSVPDSMDMTLEITWEQAWAICKQEVEE